MIYGVLMWIVTVYAFRRGRWEERLCAAGGVVASYLTPLLVSPYERMYRQLEIEVMLIDLSYFLLLALIAMCSKKFWPMWLAAMTAQTVLAHLLVYMPQGIPFVYYNSTVFWSYPKWIILALVIRWHSVERRKASQRV